MHVHRTFTGKKSKPKESVRLESVCTILAKGCELWESDKTKKKGFELPGVVNFGKVSMWRKLMADKGYFICVGLLVQAHLHGVFL